MKRRYALAGAAVTAGLTLGGMSTLQADTCYEDEPCWKASTMGNRTGWEAGVWYENGVATDRTDPSDRVFWNQGEPEAYEPEAEAEDEPAEASVPTVDTSPTEADVAFQAAAESSLRGDAQGELAALLRFWSVPVLGL